ncbi:MAG: hypothetical protein L3J83_04820 [Proteobacteria bacterium]|nr:hypothetical protein [Pseudomonadota bacterium]
MFASDLFYPIAVFFITTVMLYIYLKLCHKFHWFDHPDETRKLHNKTIPTAAGLVFMLPVILFMFNAFGQGFNDQIVVFLIVVLLLLGGYDDFKPISAKLRLMVVLFVSVGFVYSIFHAQEIGFLVLAIYIVGLVWWLNLYNFMDGADGMAVNHALITASGYWAAYVLLSNGPLLMTLNIPLFVMCLLAFLLFNFPKAEMFMGDSGSLSVAFLLGVFALYGISNHVFGEVLVISFHLVFIVDATLTLFARLYFKQAITEAHSLHLFQLLIRNGKSHVSVTLYYAFVTVALVLLTLFLHFKQAGLLIQLSVLAAETFILAFLWFYFQNKTKFKQFHR